MPLLVVFFFMLKRGRWQNFAFALTNFVSVG
ncbi:hypothetical protein TRL7639_00799 [Falsiruegeria litorea R37]|uniref:Uncharacterized protein n=1 Tax=Falsiruegeria litorea R37 TaxID=1200284 RepID=A0A1Y5RWM1_9RHOB|nr:hypothetical protein TRL7639_00799 [Falsiruegeria litorea R37]